MSKKLCPTCGNVLGRGTPARIFINREIFEHVVVCEDCAALGLLLLPTSDARFSVRGILLPYARYLRRMADGLTLDSDPRAPGLYQAADILETGRALNLEQAPKPIEPKPAQVKDPVLEAARIASSNGLGAGNGPPIPVPKETLIHHRQQKQAHEPAPAPPAAAAEGNPLAALSLAECERAILTALRAYARPLTRTELAILTGYSVTSGSFGQAIATLRAIEFVDGQAGAPLSFNAVAAASAWDPVDIPRGEHLFEFWRDKFGECEGHVLTYLRAEYPRARTRKEIAQATGYSVTSGSFGQALAKLIKVALVWRVDASGHLSASPIFVRETRPVRP
jgi:hypothetical protein